MNAPIEVLALIAFVLLIMGGAPAMGAFEPVSTVMNWITSWMSKHILGGNGKEVSVNNENVEKSDTKIEVHHHHYYSDSNPPISDGGNRRSTDENDRD